MPAALSLLTERGIFQSTFLSTFKMWNATARHDMQKELNLPDYQKVNALDVGPWHTKI